MPLKSCSLMLNHMRLKIFTTLLVAFALSAVLFAGGVGAQSGRASQQANDNASHGGGQPKRVFVGRGSDSAKGSRVTIKSDNPLNDYSAYRSGDRLYVVLPKASAGSVARGAGGKGYSDMQVQQRGDSVVLSYRVQPGAKTHIEQKFNRLDVVFDVPEGEQQTTAANQGSANRTSPPANEENRNPPATGQQSNQSPPASSTANTAATSERRPTTSATPATTQGTNASPASTTPPVITTPSTGVEQGAQNATGQTQTGSPAATPTIEPQLAQTQPPPTTVAPITTTKPATNTQTGSTLGTFLIRNWAFALVFALVVVGLGLVIAARRSSSAARPVEDEASEATGTAATLDEPRAARLKSASASSVIPASSTTASNSSAASTSSATNLSTTASSTATRDTVEASRVDAGPLVAASALAGGAAVKKTRKESRKEARKKGKKKGARAEELPLGEKPVVEESVVAQESIVAQEPVAQETVAAQESVSSQEPVAAQDSIVEDSARTDVKEPVVAETLVAGSLVAESLIADPAIEDTTVGAEDSTSKEHAAEAAEVGTTEAAEVAGMSVAADAGVVTSTAVEAVEPVDEVEAADELEEITLAAPLRAFVSAKTVAPVTEIAPAFAPEPERVQDETRNLLEGRSYERGVVGSRDSMARQMIATELLSALAGRNAERRERARAAFVEHGFFDETARDLREASAPAERAAAARSLAIYGDRAATPHLVSALEDESTDVRRAAVEALGTLRDPSAVAPLESLLEREQKQKNRIPNRVIRNAVESSREGVAEERTESTVAAEPAPAVESAPVDEVTLQTEADAPVEVTLSESADVTAVALTPFTDEHVAAPVSETAPLVEEETAEVAHAEVTHASVAEVAHASEASFVEDAHADDASADEKATLVAEAGTLVGEVPAAPAGTHAFAADEPSSEELHAVAEPNVDAIAESNVLESGVAEPQAVMETGLQPSVEAATWEITSEVGVEPFKPSSEEAAEPSGDTAATGEWFEFDMSELPADTRPSAVEQFSGEQFADEPFVSEHKASSVFEPSSGTAITTPPGAGAEAVIDELTTGVAADTETEIGPEVAGVKEQVPAQVASEHEKGVALFDELSTVPASIQQRLASGHARERAAAIVELSHVDTDEAFQQICAAFDDEAKDVRSAAARALFELRTDRAESFTRALREATPDRRRQIGAAISTSGLASEAISQLTGESREKTYEAFSLLFLMAKAGEVQPLVRAIEGHPNNEVRLAVVKLLALSGQKEILPAFRRLAVRGSLPTEVRSAVMEAIYQISSSQPSAA
jgi:HEAT repeat protein